MDRILPSCCGSEDGDLLYGVDPARGITVMIEAWMCNTCGILTITNSICVTGTDGLAG